MFLASLFAAVRKLTIPILCPDKTRGHRPSQNDPDTGLPKKFCSVQAVSVGSRASDDRFLIPVKLLYLESFAYFALLPLGTFLRSSGSL